MANDPNSPNIQDIINQAAAGANMSPAAPQSLVQPPMADPSAPQPPTLLNKPAAPSLGTEEQLQAPAAAASPNNLSEASSAAPGAAPSSITLPAQTRDNSAIPSGEQSQNQPSMLRKIGMFAADLGGAPQLAQPGSTIAQKAQGIMSILGKIGAAGTAAVGSPQQKEQAIQRQAQQNQLLQMQNEAAYRQGMLGNTAEANRIKEENAQTQARKAQGVMEAKGYTQDENNPGAFRPKTAEEILADPLLSQNMEMKNAAMASQQAKAALDKAHTAGLTSPDSLTQRNFEATLAQKKHQADAQLALAREHLQQQLTSQAMAGQRDMYNLGTNTQTGEQLGPGNATPGQLLDANGQPVPFRAMSQFAPTSQMKNVSAQAKLAAGQIPDIIKEVHDLGDSLGPVAGRWNEFMQGKVGTDNPAFAGLRADLMMQGTAVALAHARGRLPENLRQEFDTMINSPQQSPANIISVLTHIQPWLEKAGAMSEQPINTPHVAPKGGTTGGSPSSGLAVSLSKARSLPEMKGKSDADITAAIKAQGHTVKP